MKKIFILLLMLVALQATIRTFSTHPTSSFCENWRNSAGCSIGKQKELPKPILTRILNPLPLLITLSPPNRLATLHFLCVFFGWQNSYGIEGTLKILFSIYKVELLEKILDPRICILSSKAHPPTPSNSFHNNI